MRGRGITRGLLNNSGRSDNFRCRPPNTSRPPSMHVDDFMKLEKGGTQTDPGPPSHDDFQCRMEHKVMIKICGLFYYKNLYVNTHVRAKVNLLFALVNLFKTVMFRDHFF